MNLVANSDARLPAHLRRYVVEQTYENYTPIDQAVWRYILRQLKAHLSAYAHPVYVEGLEKTGIAVESIPRISEMSRKLQRFGWQAIPVSGFIPPAAFMEFQSLGYLPIACDMRTLAHVLYTPAPDIVHEAAGHAPIIADQAYAAYLQAYSQIAKKAIISHEDLTLYEAIRELSDLKENPQSTAEQITQAEAQLHSLMAQMTSVSEAALLGRMNWWTAEYGLIGDPAHPQIYGAGLLSSVGESRSCLKSEVRKIPLSLDCINFSYDITEPQPQLFVARDFAHLSQVLEELAEQMSFRVGGAHGLRKAKEAATVNTAQYSSGLQVSGIVTELRTENTGHVAYLQMTGPCQLSLADREITDHGRAAHAQGYGSPIGEIVGVNGDPARLTAEQLTAQGWQTGCKLDLQFISGITVSGRLTTTLFHHGHLCLLSFAQCTVRHHGDVLFQPEWGSYDMAIGATITSVFGGPADRSAYGQTDSFVAKTVPRKIHSPRDLQLQSIYQSVRELRSVAGTPEMFASIIFQLKDFPDDWLIRLELFEIATRSEHLQTQAQSLRRELQALARQHAEFIQPIADGLQLAETAAR